MIVFHNMKLLSSLPSIPYCLYAILPYMSIMGLPKKLTEMQIKFAQLLVTNEGRKTPTECAIEAVMQRNNYYSIRTTITKKISIGC